MFKYTQYFSALLFAIWMTSCEKPQVQTKEKGYPLADILQEQSYWEGSSIEAC